MDFNSLNKCLQEFWTPQKLGKHKDIANEHGLLLSQNLKTSTEDFFNFLKDNNFKFQNINAISWKEFFTRAGLDKYLKEDYLELALQVTTSRPAIGKGEFLFASSFNNIGFATNAGDLVDLSSNQTIEFKGVRSTISGDGNSYKLMNNSLIKSLFSLYDTSDTVEYFSRECAEHLEEYIKQSNFNEQKLCELLKRLQNTKNESLAVAKKFATLFNKTKPNLFAVVGAMQLYMYLNNKSFLVMVNDTGFKCFENPHNPEKILEWFTNEKIKLSTWQTGERGMELSI